MKRRGVLFVRTARSFQNYHTNSAVLLNDEGRVRASVFRRWFSLIECVCPVCFLLAFWGREQGVLIIVILYVVVLPTREIFDVDRVILHLIELPLLIKGLASSTIEVSKQRASRTNAMEGNGRDKVFPCLYMRREKWIESWNGLSYCIDSGVCRGRAGGVLKECFKF